MGARRHYLPAAKYAIEFQSTRPHGGATHVEHIDDTTPGISIHAPAWGRDDTAPPALLASPISIHAPAWGRDARSNSRYATVQISIHAPAWGRDTASSTARCSRWRFQSTRPHGGATTGSLHLLQVPSISIHAPAWGRDDFHGGLGYQTHDFNPRARMGARPAAIAACCDCSQFQSTRPHGGATPPTFSGALHRVDFNPRARMGARLSLAQAEQVIGKFQSTRPHGGATPRTSGERRLRAFQSTRPHGGATFIAIVIIIIEAISIHAPAWGRDLN